MIPIARAPLFALAFIAGCGTADFNLDAENAMATAMVAPPPGAPAGSCWAKDATPAIIETVTEHVLTSPATLNPDGSIATPASYRSETRQQIVKERSEVLFERPCQDAFSPEFIASLQRALAVRNFYKGTATGTLDSRTLRSVRAFQRTQGLDSAILSIAAARALGLVAVPRSE